MQPDAKSPSNCNVGEVWARLIADTGIAYALLNTTANTDI